MKAISSFIFLSLLTLSIHAEIRTITLDGSLATLSEAITVTDQQTIELKTALNTGGGCGSLAGPFFIWNVHGINFTNDLGSSPTSPAFLFTGPASVRIYTPSCPSSRAIATFEVLPSAFPPDKTMTIGAYAGNVGVTMEESTDLVNWTPSTNGQVHTNSPDARFFRIKMVKNAAPAP